MPSNDIKHFGFRQVSSEEKTRLVRGVFDSVANRYDLMNDLMSFGLHRVWKRIAISYLNLKPKQKVLDLAGGTGDLTKIMSEIVTAQGEVVLADINFSMLNIGREKLLDTGIFKNVRYVQANAEQLPFHNNQFDAIIIGFGLRNVTHIDQALKQMYQTLKPGGRCIILEFSQCRATLLNKIYDWYSFNILPQLGECITNDADSYQYLAESIRKHPNQEALKSLCMQAGFDAVEYFNLCGGIVAIHRGYKY